MNKVIDFYKAKSDLGISPEIGNIYKLREEHSQGYEAFIRLTEEGEEKDTYEAIESIHHRKCRVTKENLDNDFIYVGKALYDIDYIFMIKEKNTCQ